MWQDVVNSIFEFVGGLAVFSHCWRLWKDKLVRGASWGAAAFFAGWGLWNLYFYSHLDQWWSWGAGIVIAIANITWVAMMLHYIRHPGGKEKWNTRNVAISAKSTNPEPSSTKIVQSQTG